MEAETLKSELSFNNPATVTVTPTVKRDHNLIRLTLKETRGLYHNRTLKVVMTKAEAKQLGLELYAASDKDHPEMPQEESGVSMDGQTPPIPPA